MLLMLQLRSLCIYIKDDVMKFNSESIGLDVSNSTYRCEWEYLRKLATQEIKNNQRDIFTSRLQKRVLDHDTFDVSLASLLSEILGDCEISVEEFYNLALDIYAEDPSITEAARQDMAAFVDRDPATDNPLYPFLFFRGYHALQCHRLSHWAWRHDRIGLALLIQSRIVEACSIDIHPAASIGQRVMLDHGTGIVIGETSIIEDDVSILHHVTLGGTGKESHDRHPKIMRGVMIGAGAKVLGNIIVGEGARVAAGSVVLNNVPAYMTVVGIPARVVGKQGKRWPSQEMKQTILAETD